MEDVIIPFFGNRKQGCTIHVQIYPNFSTERIELKHIVVPYNKRGKKVLSYVQKTITLSLCVLFLAILPTIITPIGKLFVHSTFCFSCLLCESFHVCFLLQIQSFYIPKKFVGPIMFLPQIEHNIYAQTFVILCTHTTQLFWKI